MINDQGPRTNSSPPAFRTHFPVSRFIEDLPLLHDLRQEPVPIFQKALNLPRRPHDQVERERMVDRLADPDGLVDRVAARHDDEKIDVALRMWRSIGVRAEQHDLMWMEALGDPPRKTPDRRDRDVRRRITVGLHVAGSRGGFLHHDKAILPQYAASNTSQKDA